MSRFPETRHTLVRRLADSGSDDDWRRFLADYWRPVCRFAARWGKLSLDERLYALQDANWNVTALISNSGDVQERFAYDPYGKSIVLAANFTPTTDSYGWDYRFTGRELDLDTGLDYFRNRYYHNGLGCFDRRDPLTYVDGASLYRAYFVYNGSDPFGLKVEVCCRRTNIPLAGALGFPHCWLKTDTEVVGRGTVDKCCNYCICARTQQTDHSKESGDCQSPEEWYRTRREDFRCSIVDDSCDESCINDRLEVGKQVGRFVPGKSDCITFVKDVLEACCKTECTFDPVPRDPRPPGGIPDREWPGGPRF